MLPNTIYTVVLSLLNPKKAVRFQQWTDGETIVLKKHYHTGLNKINYGFTSIIFNSVLIVLNFNLIPSVKVSVNSDRLPEIIIEKINTLIL